MHEADGDGGSRGGAGPDDCGGAGCCTPLRGLRRAGGNTAAAAASNKTITYFVRRPLATARVAITGAGTDMLCRLALGGSPGSKL